MYNNVYRTKEKGYTMSVRKKVGYYTLQFKDDEDYIFNKDEFEKFLVFLSQRNESEQIFKYEKNNKAISIEKIEKKNHKDIFYYEVIFKSCKYNYNPDYMSSETGMERESDKRLEEGDKELTHTVMYLGDEECYLLKEEGSRGVSISNIKMYFQDRIDNFKSLNEYSINGALVYNTIVSDDFLDMLENTRRIISFDVTIDKKMLGSSFLNASMMSEESIRKEAIISMKSVKKQSIPKKCIQEIYDKLTGNRIERIKVQAKDIDNNNIILDSLNLNMKKYVYVEKNQRGMIISSLILAELRDLLYRYVKNVQ